MPDAYDDIVDSVITPKAQPRLKNSHLDELTDFANENQLTVGSTTGGTHNRGSKHYTGNAIDIKNSGSLSDDQVKTLAQQAQERGFKLRDERTRPKGQAVWGGPHIHIEHDDQDPYDEIINSVITPAQPSRGAYAGRAQRQPQQPQPTQQPVQPPTQQPRLIGRGAHPAGGGLIKPVDTGLTTRGVPNLQDIVTEARTSPTPPDVQARQAIRDKVIQEYYPTTVKGRIAKSIDRATSLLNPYQAGYDLLRPDEDIIDEKVQKQVEAQQRANTPEMIQQRKDFGAMPSAERAVLAPTQRFAAGLVKTAAGIADVGSTVYGPIARAVGLNPDKVSEYLNKRATLLEEGSSLPPLDEKGKEVERGRIKALGLDLPAEKAASAVIDMGYGIAEIVALKKATGLSMSKLMALETALKTSDLPAGERAPKIAESAAMGRVLDGHLSRPASAALFGIPTGVQTGTSALRGDTSVEDAILQTAIQAGSGGILGGKPKAVAEGQPSVPDALQERLRNAELRSEVQQPVPGVINEPLRTVDEQGIRPGVPRSTEVAATGRAEDPTRQVAQSGQEPRAVAAGGKPAEAQGVEGDPYAEIVDSVIPEPHHSTGQNRRVRNTEGGNKGQFKKGFKESPTEEVIPTSESVPTAGPEQPASATTQTAGAALPATAIPSDVDRIVSSVTEFAGGPEGLHADYTDEGMRKALNLHPDVPLDYMIAKGYVEKNSDGTYRLSDEIQSRVKRVAPDESSTLTGTTPEQRQQNQKQSLRGRNRTLTEQRNTAQRVAETDDLTGLGNQRAWSKALPTAEADPNMVVLSGDINNMKAVNDTLGKPAGHETIKRAADAMRQAAREAGENRVFRSGIGDEISALVPKEKAEQIQRRAEEIFGQQDAGGNKVSFSVGRGENFDAAEADLAPRKKAAKEGVDYRPKSTTKEVTNNVAPEPLTTEEARTARTTNLSEAPGAEESAPAQPEPSTTAAKKASMSADRAELDLPELPAPERKGWQQSLDNAKEKGLDRKASVLADEVLNKPRSLNDEETAGLVLRAQELKNEHSRVMKEIGAAKDPEVIKAKTAEADAIQREFNKISEATKTSGTEKGRTLAAQKLTINQDFDLVSLVQRATAARGRELTPPEHEQIKQWADKYAVLEKKLAEANTRNEELQAQKAVERIKNDVNRETRRQARSAKKLDLDSEAATLKNLIAQAWKKNQGQGVQPMGLAAIDPEGEITKLVVQLAKNRIRKGTVTAQGLVDEVHSLIKDVIDDKRIVRDMISGYGRTPKETQRAPEVKQLADIRSELKKLSSQEDIAAGKRLSPKDKTRQTQLKKQEAELTRRMEQGDFSPKPVPEPPRYTRETLALQKQLEQVKRDYENANYRATRGTWGRIKDTAGSVGNIPKTMKSMADISAVFRQGGFYSLTHPVEGLLKPGRDMLRAFTETGYRNVENAIKADPNFDLAKRSGVEFTGVDKNDPNLSHKEEGYFGTSAIDTLAKGKFNPLRVVKGTADFSERTFVSFLDSQRMHIFNQMADGLKSQGLTPRNAPESYKAIAKLINQGTGRGDLGRTGNQAAPLLNLAMFSPRLVASRVQLLNNMFNPAKMASMPKGARSMMIKDNVKFLGATVAVMGLAKAMGGTVNTDPDDGDFLKIRFGKTTYDTLTGMQQPMRYIMNMGRAIKGGETYAGKSKADLTTRFARSKLAPLAGTAVDYLTGEDFSGRQFSAKRAALEAVTPLPISDFVDAMKAEGLVKGFAKASPTVTGVGVQTYDQPAEKATTPAEKLARKFIAQKMPSEARTDEEIDQGKNVATLRARSRKGEDVSKDIRDLGAKITPRQANAILGARNKTRLQEDFNRLGIKEALIVYSVATPGQQKEVRDLLERKTTLVDLLSPDEQDDVKQRLDKLGMKRGSIMPKPKEAPKMPTGPRRDTHQGYVFGSP